MNVLRPNLLYALRAGSRPILRSMKLLAHVCTNKAQNVKPENGHTAHGYVSLTRGYL